MSNVPVNPTVEMLIGGVWVDVTPDVRLASADSGGGIDITRGRPNEAPRAEPTTVDLVLNNVAGKYSPKNPNGPHYGLLGRNQPLRVDLDRRDDAFARTEASGWGRLPSWTDPEDRVQLGEKWELTGTASNFAVGSGVATITQTASGGTQSTTYAKQYGDVEVLAKFSASDRASEVGAMLRFVSTRPSGQADGTWENGLSDFQVAGGTIAESTVFVKYDTKSALLTVAGSPASLTLRPVAARRAPVKAGGSYRQRAWYRVTTSLTLKQTWEWYDYAGNLISTSTNAGSALTSGGWYALEYSVTAPIGAVTASYGPTIDGSPANGTLLYVDELHYHDFSALTWYSAYLAPMTAPTPDRLRVGKIVPGDSTAFGVDWEFGNFVAGTDLWIRAQISGGRVRARVWPDTEDEPDDWQINNYDNRTDEPAGPMTGQVGMLVAVGTTTTLTVSEFSARQWRAHAEVTKLPPRWDLSRQDRWVPIQAKGILRRLGQGRKELESAVTLHLKSYTPSALWFPLESSNGGSASNAVQGGLAGFLRDVTFGEPDLEGTLALPGVSGIATFDQATSRLNGQAINYSAVDAWTFLFFWRIPAQPAVETLWFQMSSTGTVRTWTIFIRTDHHLRIEGRAADNTLLVTDTITPYLTFPPGCWIVSAFYVNQDGSNTDWAFDYTQPGSDLGFFTANGTYAGTPGKFRSFRFNSGADLANAGGYQLTQCFHYAGRLPFVSYEFARAAKAYAEEAAGDRFRRLTANAGVRRSMVGSVTGTEPMSAQLPGKLLDLLDECGAAEGSFVQEERGEFAISLVTKLALMNNTPLELDIDAGHMSAPLEPEEDDQQTRNHVTVSRPAGGFAVSIQTSGPLNVNEPEVDPDGVGLYAEGPELPLGTDLQLQAAADWRRSIGTLDESRYPSITADLTSSAYLDDQTLTAAALAIDAGRMLNVANPEVSPDAAPQLVYSYTEHMDQYEHKLTWVAQPGRVWQVGVTGSDSTTVRYRDELRVSPGGLYVDADFNAGTDTLLPLVYRQRYVLDEFARTVASGVGTADRGGAYVTANGVAANYNVSTDQFRITNTSTNVNRLAYLPDVEVADFDLYWTVASSAVALTQSIIPFAIARLVDALNYLRFEITFNTGSTVDARIRKVVAGVDTSLALASAVVAYSAGSEVECRAKGDGTVLRLKIWVGATEPDQWNLIIDDSTFLDAGHPGLGTVVNSGNTNVNPETRFNRWKLVHQTVPLAGAFFPTADDPKVADFDLLISGSKLRLRHVGQNLATNGDLETGSVAGTWEGSSGSYTVSIDPNNPYAGRFCGRCLASGAGTGGAVQTQAANGTTVAAISYAIFGWIKTEAAATAVRLGVDWYQANGTTFVSTTLGASIVTVANTWTWFSALVTSPALGVRARLKVQNVFAGATNLWFDDLRLVPVSSYTSEPQLVTVDQVPVNGIIKTIPAGSKVALGKPGRVAWNI